jgi:hypothetical protein
LHDTLALLGQRSAGTLAKRPREVVKKKDVVVIEQRH